MSYEVKTENLVLRVNIDGRGFYVSKFNPGELEPLIAGKFFQSIAVVDPNSQFPHLVKTPDKAWLYDMSTKIRPIATRLGIVIHSYMPDSNVKIYVDAIVLKTATQIVDYKDSDEVIIQYANE